MKKIASIVLFVLLLIALTACESSTVKNARAAYENQEYKEVVSLLKNYETKDPEVQSMLLASRIHVAYNKKDYEEAVDLTKEFDEVPEDLEKIVALSKANLAVEEKDYAKAVFLLSEFEDRFEHKVYQIAVAYAVETALAEFDVEATVDLCKAESQVEDTVYQLILEKCSAFDYDYFVFAEALAEELPDTVLKLELTRYLSANTKNKTKAFMQGEWLIVYDEATNDTAVVNLQMNETDSMCVGYLVSFSDFLAEYNYAENDIYWKYFNFNNDMPVSVDNMVRTPSSARYVSATVELDMEKEELHIHVPDTVNVDRVYTKVKD